MMMMMMMKMMMMMMMVMVMAMEMEMEMLMMNTYIPQSEDDVTKLSTSARCCPHFFMRLTLATQVKQHQQCLYNLEPLIHGRRPFELRLAHREPCPLGPDMACATHRERPSLES